MSDGLQMLEREPPAALRGVATNALKKELRRLRTVHDLICERGARNTLGVRVRDDIFAIRDELTRRGIDSSPQALPPQGMRRG